MTSVDPILDALRRLVEEHPHVASAGLLALAVEHEVLTERGARALARRLDLTDFETTKAVLAREVDRAGETATLVGLVRTGRRIQRRTEILLKQARST